MDELNHAKKLILDCYSVEYLKRAFTLRTQDPMFGRIGQLVAEATESPICDPCQIIRLGYEFLCDVEPQTI